MRQILNSYTLKELQGFISKSNIKGYSKLKKAQLVNLMLKQEHINKFRNLPMKTRPARQARPAPAPQARPAPAPQATQPKNDKEKVKFLKEYVKKYRKRNLFNFDKILQGKDGLNKVMDMFKKDTQKLKNMGNINVEKNKGVETFIEASKKLKKNFNNMLLKHNHTIKTMRAMYRMGSSN
tara:strand:+ start:102 stop:641 length:540 start_codon:yes stop_codon:yes gene_type:complete